MKKLYFLSFVTAAMLLASAPVHSQYITEAPAGGFDFSQGKDYVVIYAPDEQVSAIGSKMLSDQNLDPDMEKNQFYYWVCDWSEAVKSQFTLYNIEDDTPNSWGAPDKINMTPLWWWGGGNFTAKSQPYDLSKIDNDHILHIGFCDIGEAAPKPQFVIGYNKAGQNQPANYNGFGLKAGVQTGKEVGDFVGVGTFTKKKTWYYLDIPVADLVDPNGDFAYTYDFSSPIDGSIFTVNFGASEKEVTCSKYTYGAIDTDTGMKTVTINQVGMALAIDAVFFYKADDTSGISAIERGVADVDAPAYNLSGQKVDASYRGVVIKNGHKYIQ